MQDNYPVGAANDPRAPYNQSLTKKVEVEVGVEIGTIIKVSVENTSEIKKSVKEEIIKKFKIDNKDTILNNITIYNQNFE